MMKKTGSRCLLAIAGLLILTMQGCSRPSSDGVVIAVATNFIETARDLEAAFEAESGLEITLASGSTGQLYAQIENGAPFSVFLSADRERPRRLVSNGIGVEGTQFTYASGQLVLWSVDEALLSEDGGAILSEGNYRALAIANPDLAPYGLAAMQTLGALGLEAAVSDRIVMGQNIGQAFTLVASGNAELGFVARSQVLGRPEAEQGSSWLVPAGLHEPIRQDAVLLKRGINDEASYKFIAFLRGDEAARIIKAHGYEPG